MDEPQKYAVIIDRISQDIQFYRAYLKEHGAAWDVVVNNPFWWTADDKFLQLRAGLETWSGDSANRAFATHKHPEGTTDQSMRN